MLDIGTLGTTGADTTDLEFGHVSSLKENFFDGMLEDAVDFDYTTKAARCHAEYSRAVAATVPAGFPRFFRLRGTYHDIPKKSTFDTSPCSDNVCGDYIYVGNADSVNGNIAVAGTPIYRKYAWEGRFSDKSLA